jgi:biopolymer transport protein ExbD
MYRWTSRKPPRHIADIHLVPFMDLILVLLFVFLIIVPLLSTDWLPTTLPALAGQDSVVLEPVSDQAVVLNGRQMAMADLSTALKDLRVTRPGVGVMVKISAGQPISKFAELAQMLKEAGVERMALQTVAAP